jgi:hypothetical protein
MSLRATLNIAGVEPRTFESAPAAGDGADLLAHVADIQTQINTALSTIVAQDHAGVEKRRRMNGDDDDDDDDGDGDEDANDDDNDDNDDDE